MNKYLGAGGSVTQLEQAFAAKMGTKYAVAMNSGTATLHATLLAMGIGPGDEVIVPALGPIMTAAAVIQAGAKPVFCDVEPLTFTMDIRGDLWKKLSPQTKAVISVALYGLPCRLDELQDICEERQLWHIEDNAQCVLSTFRDHLVGQYSDVASYSFEQSKHINCGEGGMITADDPGLAREIRNVANHGYACMTSTGSRLPKETIQQPGYKRHNRIGWNYRLAEHLAEIALEQVNRLDDIVRQRQRVARALRIVLQDYPFFSLQVVPGDRTHSYYALGAAYHDDYGVSWKEFYDRYKALGGDGIYGGWVVPYHEPAIAELGFGDHCPGAEYLAPRLMQFPTNETDPVALAKKVGALRVLCEDISRGK